MKTTAGAVAKTAVREQKSVPNFKALDAALSGYLGFAPTEPKAAPLTEQDKEAVRIKDLVKSDGRN